MLVTKDEDFVTMRALSKHGGPAVIWVRVGKPTNDILEVVLTKLPMPTEDTPWEAILDFRNDTEAKGYLTGLRVWMAEISKQTLSPKELEEKLDWLLFKREQHIKAHKIRCNFGTFGAAFVASMSILEDLAKIRWGKAAEGIVSLTNRKAELMRLEIESPNIELNYILKVREKFGNATT